jgi:hypothetical protein
MGAPHAFHSWRHGKIREIVRGAPEWGEWAADLGEFVLSSLEIHELFSEEEAVAGSIKVEGSIKMDAQKDFGVSAGGSVGFFGIQAATLTSAVWTSVSAVVAASLKGTLFAGVASAYTSLKGYRKIELGSDHGEIAFNAKRDVQTSTEASAIAAGKTLAQVSGEKNAYFNGGQVVWVGTTADVRWGLHLSTKGLMIGKANAAGTMASASINTTRGILIDTQGISVKSASSSMVLSGTNIIVEAGSIELKGKDDEVRIGAKKMLIDG